MGLFGSSKSKSGGLMNVIRCDEAEYLVWKWRPLGQGVNSTSRENATEVVSVSKTAKLPYLFTNNKAEYCKILLLALMMIR